MLRKKHNLKNSDEFIISIGNSDWKNNKKQNENRIEAKRKRNAFVNLINWTLSKVHWNISGSKIWKAALGMMEYRIRVRWNGKWMEARKTWEKRRKNWGNFFYSWNVNFRNMNMYIFFYLYSLFFFDSLQMHIRKYLSIIKFEQR